MLSFIKNILTEKNNATGCPVRIGFLLTGLIYHVGAFVMILVQHANIDMLMLGQYIQHMSLLGGVMAGGIGAKSVLKGDAQ